MFRKLALIVGAVIALAGGVASAPAPAAAQVGFGMHVGPGYGYGYGPPRGYGGYGRYRDYDRRYYGPPRRHYGPPRRFCEKVVVRRRIHGDWRRVVERRCYPRRYY